MAQQQAEPERRPRFHAKQLGQSEDQCGFQHHQCRCHADHEQRIGQHGVNIDHHANGHEEQAEQHGAERLDVRFDLVPIGRIGQHDARNKRAERRRQVEHFHHGRRCKHSEQANNDEQFLLAQSPDQAQQRPDDVAPRQHEADDGTDRIQPHHPSRRGGRIRGRA